MKIKIITDGNPSNTKVIDQKSGKEIKNISTLITYINADSGETQTILFCYLPEMQTEFLEAEMLVQKGPMLLADPNRIDKLIEGKRDLSIDRF